VRIIFNENKYDEKLARSVA